jgi:hypothetical protein
LEILLLTRAIYRYVKLALSMPFYILIFSRIVIGITFTVSFANKIRDVSAFERTIFTFNIVPRRLCRTAAVIFLSGELSVVILVIQNAFLWFGLLLAIVMLFVFCIAIIFVLLRQMRIPCNCFGTTTRVVSYYDLLRNIGFILCAFSGLVSLSVLDGRQFTLGMIEWGLIGLISVVFVLIWMHIDEIVHIFVDTS